MKYTCAACMAGHPDQCAKTAHFPRLANATGGYVACQTHIAWRERIAAQAAAYLHTHQETV